MQSLCLAVRVQSLHLQHILYEWIQHDLQVDFTALFFLLLVGCVLHSSVPLPCSGRSFGPWSHTARSFGWDCLLLETRLVQTGRSAGIQASHFVLERKSNSILHQHWRNRSQQIVKGHLDYSVCDRCGLMLALRFFSPTPSDWAP